MTRTFPKCGGMECRTIFLNNQVTVTGNRSNSFSHIQACDRIIYLGGSIHTVLLRILGTTSFWPGLQITEEDTNLVIPRLVQKIDGG